MTLLTYIYRRTIVMPHVYDAFEVFSGMAKTHYWNMRVRRNFRLELKTNGEFFVIFRIE